MGLPERRRPGGAGRVLPDEARGRRSNPDAAGLPYPLSRRLPGLTRPRDEALHRRTAREPPGAERRRRRGDATSIPLVVSRRTARCRRGAAETGSTLLIASRRV